MPTPNRGSLRTTLVSQLDHHSELPRSNGMVVIIAQRGDHVAVITRLLPPLCAIIGFRVRIVSAEHGVNHL